ncbi:hypothetical protein DFH29DRAFT_1003030 [Suillus ampliporus]|nr:hypothetical protein DFH29DRAFT_1003030 [Suillus ampliporus]
MFIWYRHSALTIVYLSDVPPSSRSGALARSAWNKRGWTFQEFVAPKVVLFYRKDWTLYLDDDSPNHKECPAIMEELEGATGIDVRALISFRPGMRGAREKLQWASTRVTTVQEDIAYSLFGIFSVNLPVIYGERKQNALGRLLQEIVARSGDITALDWELASKLYTLLDNISAPRFANCRLHLPCIAFRVTEVRRRGPAQQIPFTYGVKVDGLQDLLITTEETLVPFSRARPTPRTFLLVRPWDRYLLELPDFAEPSDFGDDTESEDDYWSAPESPLDDSPGGPPVEQELVDSEFHSRALRLIVRLGQPFGAFLLAQQRGGEYKRIASDYDIIAQVEDVASVDSMMDVRTVEIL